NHKVIDDPQLASIAIAASTKYLVYYISRYGDLTGIKCSHRLLYHPSLGIGCRIFGQRQSRGDFFLCFRQILFCCFFNQL
ncbi:MAG: hypothetical protein J6P72_10565, partial [Firmicutes bacterium]|nr:hypothetical protein [Bacillota bacterium]